MFKPTNERAKQIEVKKAKRLFDKPLNIQKFASYTPEQIREAVKDLDTIEKMTAKLVEMGVIKETIKEVEAKISKESVNAFLVANKDVSEGIYNSNVKSFLAKKLGKKEDEITEDIINGDLVTKTVLTEQEKKYQDKLIEQEIFKCLGDNAGLLKPHIKLDTVKVGEDFKITGLDEQINELKTSYPDLFKTKEEILPGGTGNKKENFGELNPWNEKTWDEIKQVELFKANPELATKYMQETGYDY